MQVRGGAHPPVREEVPGGREGASCAAEGGPARVGDPLLLRAERRNRCQGGDGFLPPHPPQMYNFTSFTVSLNELQSGMEKTLAPTDCRLRPDIRGMENGDMGTRGQGWGATRADREAVDSAAPALRGGRDLEIPPLRTSPPCRYDALQSLER